MNHLFKHIAILLFVGCLMSCEETVSIEQDDVNWRGRELPSWYDDAKLGIFVHWGLYSVPAYAPTENVLKVGEPISDSVMTIIKNGGGYESSYAEWYKSNLKHPKSQTLKYQKEKYGEDFDYYDFAPQFNQANKSWKAKEWAEIFKQAGAKYVVLTTKHHDSFTLWPTAIEHPYIPDGKQASTRDLVGELTSAVRAQGIKMGLYYSSGLDWAYQPDLSIVEVMAYLEGIKLPWKNDKNLYSDEYSKVVDSHWKELIKNYQPDVLWSDIGSPGQGKLEGLINSYLEKNPDAVVNDRWRPSSITADFMTPEYAVKDSIVPYKWETCRGMGNSFGFNQFEDENITLSSAEIIHMLIDVVSKNGNLLLNVGPKADGTIPEIQLDRLRKLGSWLSVNGEGIYGSRPWVRAEGLTSDGDALRFTKKNNDVFVFVLGQPKNNRITLVDVGFSEGKKVELLGESSPLKWQVKNNDLIIELPELAKSEALTFKLSGYKHHDGI